MVNRIKTWIPPTIPLRDNLPAWKLICNDIHDNLLLAGLIQTTDTGQLDIDAVSVLPADDTYAGYRMYRFNDPLQTTYPILIRLDFGCGIEGLANDSGSWMRTRTLKLKFQVGSNTLGDGQFLGIVSKFYYYPQEYGSATASSTIQLTDKGNSFFSYNEERGFFGFVYGAGSRNKPKIVNNGYYIGCTLAIFIQRSLDEFGDPDARGISVYGINLYNQNSSINWPNYTYSPGGNSIMQSITDQVKTFSDMAPTIGPAGSRAFGGEVSLQPIYSSNPYVQIWPSILTYWNADIPQSTIIDVNGTNFMTLGNEMGFITDIKNQWNNALAMIWEGTDLS